MSAYAPGASSHPRRVRASVVLLAATLVAIGVGAADASGAAMFAQCPPVGNNLGCSQLIVVPSSGPVLVQTDPAAPPKGYDGSEDTLIGIQNNSKKAITSINLASTSVTIFGFDGDGLCNSSQWPSAPPRTPPGCPGPQGFGTTGYEGPNSSFSNVSTNSKTGTVTFPQPVAPGASTYWGLEEALAAGQLQSGAGGHPITGPAIVAGPTVTFPLTCVGAATCNGIAKAIATQRLKGKGKHKRKHRTKKVVVGSVSFSTPGGQTLPISVTLNRAGRKLRSSVGGFPAQVTVFIAQPTGQSQATDVAKVKFTGAKRH